MPTWTDFICPSCGHRFTYNHEDEYAEFCNCPACDHEINLDDDPLDLAEQYFRGHAEPVAPVTFWERLCITCDDMDMGTVVFILLIISAIKVNGFNPLTYYFAVMFGLGFVISMVTQALFQIVFSTRAEWRGNIAEWSRAYRAFKSAIRWPGR